MMRKHPLLRRSAILLTAGIVFGQDPRDTSRAAYRMWRDPAARIESDAASPNPAFAADVGRAKEAAAAFFSHRSEPLAATAAQLKELRQSIPDVSAAAESILKPLPEEQRLLTASNLFLATAIGNYAETKDPALLQVRQAMERESAALGNLRQLIETRGKNADAAAKETSLAEAARDAASRALDLSSVARTQIADQLGREAQGWEKYYGQLAMASTTSSTTTGLAGPQPPAPRLTAVQATISRLTGAWALLPRGKYSGARPLAVDMQMVDEGNGRITGSFGGRLLVSPEGKNDAIVQFTFEGEVKEARSQAFALLTVNGNTGTIELIDGGAFNLLEINFKISPPENQIAAGNFILVKK